jgi:hypothetical protein
MIATNTTEARHHVRVPLRAARTHAERSGPA